MPYDSARDMPKFREVEQQLSVMRLMRSLLPEEEQHLLDAFPAQLDHMADTVDSFYALLGPRNWIFHDDLNLSAMAELVADNESDPESAEQAMIEWYRTADCLSRLVLRLHRHEGLRARMPLLELALADFHSERYYAVVQVLLSVMDGFVNDLTPANRKGLHARDPEGLDAWDSVVGHHLGLTNAHKSFVKSFKVRSAEPVHELHRNGIVHGTLTNYNNLIVATKAWNRLFAVADWACAAETQQNETARSSEVTLEEIVEHVKSNAEVNAALDAFTPQSLTVDDDALTSHPVYLACNGFLNAWKGRNYGHMARAGTRALGETVAPIQLRNDYQEHTLTQFRITAVRHRAASVALVETELTIDDMRFTPALTWIREDGNGQSVAPNESGEWRLMSWGYLQMVRDSD